MRIDFYVSPSQQPQADLMLACRILAKAYAKNETVFVNMPDQASALKLDQLLWTFRDTSFIPHIVGDATLDPMPPIQIAYQHPPNQQAILMNLSPTLPRFHTQFQRIIEIVLPHAESKKHAREHYRYYQQQGHELHTHTLKQ